MRRRRRGGASCGPGSSAWRGWAWATCSGPGRLAGAGASAGDDLSVILVWLDGGPPQHETYDPKPEAPSEFRGPLKAIDTAVPGVQVSELLPEHARLMDKMSIIRSLHHDNGDHFAAAHWMLTGYLGSNASNMTPMYPSAGSIIARLKGAKRPGMPAYVGLPNTHSVGIKPGYHGAAYLGRTYQPVPGRRRPELRRLPGARADPARRARRGAGSTTAGACSTPIDAARRSAESESSDLDRFSREAFAMLTGPEARRAFDLSKEDPRLRDRYGRHQWGQSALLARRLVGAGVRFVTLTFGGWDFHSSLDKGMHSVLPVLDRAVGTLVDDLDQRGQLDSTLVIVMGEFGRTPRINKGLPNDPVPGRDHWGQRDERPPGRRRPEAGRRGRLVERPGRGPPRPPGDAQGPARHDLRPARHRPRRSRSPTR